MAERTESQGFYEMLWDCDHCETKGLLANSQRHCAGCGAPQNPDKRYFPKEGEAKKVDGHRFEGSDRHCPACNTPMGATASNCTKCGSPLDGSKEVRAVAAPVAPATPRRKIWPFVVGAIALIVFLTWFFFIRTKDAKLTVAAHRWERSIAIEKYGDYPVEAWRDELPAVVHPQGRRMAGVGPAQELLVREIGHASGGDELGARAGPLDERAVRPAQQPAGVIGVRSGRGEGRRGR